MIPSVTTISHQELSVILIYYSLVNGQKSNAFDMRNFILQCIVKYCRAYTSGHTQLVQAYTPAVPTFETRSLISINALALEEGLARCCFPIPVT